MRLISMILAATVSAFAHTNMGEAGGFMQGLIHPISGLDHILAMVGVGMAAYFANQKGFLAIGAFMASMVLAAIIGFSGIAMVGVEEGILVSVAAIFLMVGFASKLPTYFIASAVGVFGFFHGFAHGAEFTTGSFASFIAGFSVATFALHMTGLAIAYVLNTKFAKA
ncbi:MAG: HupE/UreJ family protein [Campylobacterales bacterium]|nr:HupE/UreJ family protein [Campylobacterales bacterium]